MPSRVRAEGASERTWPVAARRGVPLAAARWRRVARRVLLVTLTLLVRAYCHLCDEMRDALAPIAAAHAAAVETIDIDAAGNEVLAAAWGECVPVLFAGAPDATRELCHYHLDRDRVVAALAATPVALETKIR